MRKKVKSKSIARIENVRTKFLAQDLLANLFAEQYYLSYIPLEQLEYAA